VIFSLIRRPKRPSTPLASVTRYSVDSAASLARSPAVGIGSSTKTPSRPRITGTVKSTAPTRIAIVREPGVGERVDKGRGGSIGSLRIARKSGRGARPLESLDGASTPPTIYQRSQRESTESA
jgi:hypothetical protein